MRLYEWQEGHSGGERPVYKLKDDDDYYLYYCDSKGPGCNHKGCTTLPTSQMGVIHHVMNQSTLNMPCNYTGFTDPESTKGICRLRLVQLEGDRRL